MSSTYLTHKLCLCSAEATAVCSKCSIYMLLRIGDSGEPIAMTSLCWQNSSFTWKYVVFRQISNSSISLLPLHLVVIVLGVFHLTKTRSPNQTQESKNCIYNIPCDCGKRYIGETCRPLQTRINEHKRNTTNREIDKSKIAEHSWEEKHRFQWDK